MNTDPNVPQGLDPTTFYLTKAIKKTETGASKNAYTATGKSGEFGAYQYTPDTWNADASKYLGQEVALDKATPEQQNQVAYSKVASLLKQGYTQSEVASIWNSGYADPNKIGKGTNKFGANYDVPGYVNKVKQNYLSYAQGENQLANSDSSGYITSEKVNSNTDQQGNQDSSQQKPGLIQGLIQGIASPFLQGASSVRALGDVATGNTDDYNNLQNQGADYGYFGKAKPVGAGTDITKPLSENVGPLLSAAGTGVKAGLETAGAANAPGLIGKLFSSGGGVLETAAPIVQSSTGIPAETFSTLSAAEKLDSLTQSLEGATASQKLVLNKAISHILPDASKELGLGPSLIGKIISKVGSSGISLVKNLAKAGLTAADLEILSHFIK